MFGRGMLVGDAEPDDVFASDHCGGHVELSRMVNSGQQVAIDSVMLSIIEK